MQTFLVCPNIVKSVQCLDNKRLGKQRVEAMQILKALSNPNYGWQNHPAVKMWQGYEVFLMYYHNACINEWIKRGYKNTMKLFEIRDCYPFAPKWWGNEQFHSSHRAALLYKNYEYYKQFNWTEKPEINYYWPTKQGY